MAQLAREDSIWTGSRPPVRKDREGVLVDLKGAPAMSTYVELGAGSGDEENCAHWPNNDSVWLGLGRYFGPTMPPRPSRRENERDQVTLMFGDASTRTLRCVTKESHPILHGRWCTFPGREPGWVLSTNEGSNETAPPNGEAVNGSSTKKDVWFNNAALILLLGLSSLLLGFSGIPVVQTWGKAEVLRMN
ncbi:hypothetical protein IW262DRAFT_1299671 [Armillaria fumosa]|nr:hypothetical protein IW262DRAFT_1299671 [Armillaria fumosa]